MGISRHLARLRWNIPAGDGAWGVLVVAPVMLLALTRAVWVLVIAVGSIFGTGERLLSGAAAPVAVGPRRVRGRRAGHAFCGLRV